MSAPTINAERQSAEACSYRMVLGGRFALFAEDGHDVTPKSRKCRAILAYLAAHAGERIRRERLIDLLWGDRFDAQARLSLRQALFEIRRTAGESLVCSDREHVWMDPSLLLTVEEGGEFFAGLTGITTEFDDWVRVEREQQAGEAFAKLNAEAERLIADGRGKEAAPLIKRMRQMDPLHDACVRLAMKADHQAGSPSAVQKRFNDFAELLDRELGVRPASETSALHDWLIADLTKKPAQQPAETPRGIEPGAPVPIASTAEQPPRPPLGLLARTKRFANKRWAMVAAATIVLLVFIAIEARDFALKQRSDAERMAEVMLANAKDDLQPSGKIAAIQNVASSVVDYYAGKSNADLSDPELRQRSHALALLAQAQNMRGNSDAAIQLFTEAAAGTAEAVRRKPDDPQRLFDHAQNVFWIGEIERNRGNIDAAESYYREYKRLADRMSALDPDNLRWRMEVLYANEDLGIALLAKRHFAEAVGQFESALAPMQSVISIEGAKPDYQKEFVNVLGWLADAERASGRLDLAVAVRQRQIASLEQSIALGSDDLDFRERLVPAHEGLGVLYGEQGQPDRAIAEHREALSEAQDVNTQEPGHSLWDEVAADVRLQLASNLIIVGKQDEAALQISLGCGSAADLMRTNPGSARSRHLRTSCFADAAELSLASGKISDAQNYSKEALIAARSERSDDPLRDRYLVASAYRLIGDSRARSGDSAGAAAAWSSGLAQLPVGVTERPFEMKARSMLLSRLGRAAEAAAIENRLKTIGYRRST